MPAVEIPLESYRLAQITQPICCYICEAENSQNAEFCRHCFAPMALAHQARANNVRPHRSGAESPIALNRARPAAV